LQQPAGRQQVQGRRAQAGKARALIWRGPFGPRFRCPPLVSRTHRSA
jgi:hypothetical protein